MGSAASTTKNSKNTTTAVETSTVLSSPNTYPVVGPNEIMRKKNHGTSDQPVQESLRWNVSRKKADNICNYNRHFAEPSGSAFQNKLYLDEFKASQRQNESMKFYDSVTGKLLFEAALHRSHDAFDRESRQHGWPSFRDDEVNWDNVRCLKNGECVSLTGTHLGHNLPDRNGNRYCINLVSIAGNPSTLEE